MKKITLPPTTRLAIRAAIAISIALYITTYINLGHNWWGALTVLVLLAPSLGESIQRSFKRFLMTIIGCSVGWCLYIAVAHYPLLHLVIIMLCVFAIMYCTPTWYATSMFFIGILVVFLFGALSIWSGELMWQRVAQTGMGAVIVILVSAVVLPNFSRHPFQQQFLETLTNIEKATRQLLSQYLAPETQKKNLSLVLQQLSQELFSLQSLYQVVRYEKILSLQLNHRTDRLLTIFEIMNFYLDALHHSFCKLEDIDALVYFQPMFQQLHEHIQQRFQDIQKRLHNQPIQSCPPWEERYLESTREYFLKARAMQQFSPQTFITVAACIYYCRRLEAELSKVATLL